jgi:hypothetical protein
MQSGGIWASKIQYLNDSTELPRDIFGTPAVQGQPEAIKEALFRITNENRTKCIKHGRVQM